MPRDEQHASLLSFSVIPRRRRSAARPCRSNTRSQPQRTPATPRHSLIEARDDQRERRGRCLPPRLTRRADREPRSGGEARRKEVIMRRDDTVAERGRGQRRLRVDPKPHRDSQSVRARQGPQCEGIGVAPGAAFVLFLSTPRSARCAILEVAPRIARSFSGPRHVASYRGPCIARQRTKRSRAEEVPP